MFNFLHRLRHLNRSRNKDIIGRKIEDALKSSAHRLNTVNPDTEGQWRRLRNALEFKRDVSYSGFGIPKWIQFKPVFAFAITGMALIVVGVIWLRYSSIRIYETAKGQRSNITLQDSTEVTLNYMSELKVDRSPFEKTRHVELKGEALFHVHRNGTPFIISTDIGTVQVLGTQFNVRVRDNKMEVAVINGTVKVSANRNGADSSIILNKDQIVVCEKNNFPEIPGTLPFSEYPGWTSGKFMFYRTSLLSACKELELQFDIRIKIEKPQQQNVTITGIVNSQSVDGALTTLTQLTGNKYRNENGNYIIY